MDENVGNGVEKKIVEVGSDPKPAGGLFASLIDIFIEPSKVFRRIDAGMQWWKGFIPLLIINLVIAWFSLPVQRAAVAINERGLSTEELERTLEMMKKFGPLGLIVVPIVIIIILLISAGLTNLLVNIISAKSDFKKCLSLVTFAGFIAVLEQLISLIIIMSKDLSAVESVAELKPQIGFGALFPDLEGFGAALMQSLTVFQIWYFIVFVFGLASIFKITRKKAAVPAVVMWLVGLVFIFISQKFSSMG
ncbi:MAG: YIP1 family protein [Candidatus Krumholzibacteriota bacterium]|nr:YIP1 family protein [Candidatus Krumholzibacteriota bacterium]